VLLGQAATCTAGFPADDGTVWRLLLLVLVMADVIHVSDVQAVQAL
jgi:hypothetical protein